MITDKDVNKLKQVFATKDDLKKLATKTDLTVEISQDKYELRQDINSLEDKFNNRFDQVMTGLDKIVGELKAFREEQAAHYLKHEEIDYDIASIKAVPIIAQALAK